MYSQVLFFQDSATPVMEGIVDLHNIIMGFLVVILVFVLVLLRYTIYNFFILQNFPKKANDLAIREAWFITKDLSHHSTLEIVWTVIPALILIWIGIPSFVLLYSMDEITLAEITLKVMGHQWYWSYEYSDMPYMDEDELEEHDKEALEKVGYPPIVTYSFDSYMLSEAELKFGGLRLLEVDSVVVLPVETHIRVLVSAVDVLHSWSVNALGVKLDAVPGRLNQFGLYINREGMYYGQCSEICGVNHGFMPIAVRAVEYDDYVDWIKEQRYVVTENDPKLRDELSYWMWSMEAGAPLELDDTLVIEQPLEREFIERELVESLPKN